MYTMPTCMCPLFGGSTVYYAYMYASLVRRFNCILCLHVCVPCSEVQQYTMPICIHPSIPWYLYVSVHREGSP